MDRRRAQWAGDGGDQQGHRRQLDPRTHLGTVGGRRGCVWELSWQVTWACYAKEFGSHSQNTVSVPRARSSVMGRSVPAEARLEVGNR